MSEKPFSIEGEKSKNTYGEASQEWRDFYDKFCDLREQILEKIFALNSQNKRTFLDRIKEKENKSFSSVNDPHTYLTYHKSIGSSVGPTSAPNLDFEREHSLLKFYEELERDLK